MKPIIQKISLLCLLLGYCIISHATPTLSVKITGVTGDALENISARLKINLRPTSERTSIADIQSFYKKAPEEIEEALKPFGYFKPRITSHLTHQGDIWHANFHIQLGRPLNITRIQINMTGEGRADKEFKKLNRNLPIKVGQRLNVDQYEDAKQALYELAQERGYFQAKLTHSELIIDLKHYRASIIILFNTGRRYRFGDISFSPTPYSDRFLHRFVRFKPYDPYLHKKVQRLQEDLSNSNYFQQVLIEHKTTSHYLAPIDVKLKTRKARQYTLGIGYGKDTKLRGLIGLNLRRLNPYGHQFKAEAKIAQRKNHNIKATYIIPGKNPANDQYQISGLIEDEEQNAGDSTNKALAVSYITHYKKWQQTFSLTLLDEKFTLVGRPQLRDKLLIPSISLLLTESNDQIRPTQGYQINLNLRGASQHVLGKNSFFQARADFKWLQPLTPTENQRILLKAAVGYTRINNIFNLPLSLQYFAGGVHSVRGYSYQSIGPGKAFMTASAEFQQRIKGDVYFAIFYDIGNVSSKFFNDIKRSAGVGIVYVSPIGDIEVDFAKPLNKNLTKKEKRLRIQFSIGPEIFSIGTES